MAHVHDAEIVTDQSRQRTRARPNRSVLVPRYRESLLDQMLEALLVLEALLERIAMKKLSANQTEHKCPACHGTGYPVVGQPVRPGAKSILLRARNAAVKDA